MWGRQPCGFRTYRAAPRISAACATTAMGCSGQAFARPRESRSLDRPPPRSGKGREGLSPAGRLRAGRGGEPRPEGTCCPPPLAKERRGGSASAREGTTPVRCVRSLRPRKRRSEKKNPVGCVGGFLKQPFSRALRPPEGDPAPVTVHPRQ